jgi:vacuolar-type H+-ATPase subunit I/STV1
LLYNKTYHTTRTITTRTITTRTITTRTTRTMAVKTINIQEKLDQLFKKIEIWKNEIINHKEEIVIKEKYIKDTETKIKTVMEIFMEEVVEVEEEIEEVEEEIEEVEEEIKQVKKVVKEEIEEIEEVEEIESEITEIESEITEIESETTEVERTPAWRNRNIDVLVPPNNNIQQIQNTVLKSLIGKTFDIPFKRNSCKDFYDSIDKQINPNSTYAILNTIKEDVGVIVYNNSINKRYNSDVKNKFDYSTIAPTLTNKIQKAIESVWHKLEGEDNEVLVVLIDENNKYLFYNIKVGYVNNTTKKFIEDKFYEDDCTEYMNWRKKYK